MGLLAALVIIASFPLWFNSCKCWLGSHLLVLGRCTVSALLTVCSGYLRRSALLWNKPCMRMLEYWGWESDFALNISLGHSSEHKNKHDVWHKMLLIRGAQENSSDRIRWWQIQLRNTVWHAEQRDSCGCRTERRPGCLVFLCGNHHVLARTRRRPRVFQHNHQHLDVGIILVHSRRLLPGVSPLQRHVNTCHGLNSSGLTSCGSSQLTQEISRSHTFLFAWFMWMHVDDMCDSLVCVWERERERDRERESHEIAKHLHTLDLEALTDLG